MLKKGSRPVQWALLCYNAQEQRINGTSSSGTIDEARRLARGVLQLSPSVAFILIHACDPVGVIAPQSVTRVDWDQEWDA